MVGIRISFFIVSATCVGLCQQSEKQAWTPLPDAPSAVTTRIEGGTWTDDSSLRDGAVRQGSAGMPEVQRAEVARAAFALVDQGPRAQQETDPVAHLFRSWFKRNPSYHPAAANGLMGRATYAASSIFITRDSSGKGRLNTNYFLGVLTSAMLHTAYRPYWRRSVSDPASDFGSRIGNDAGMNLYREFGPNLEQLMKSHAPRFVSRIEERIDRR